MRYFELYEKRRNPNQNPKTHMLAELEKYRGQRDIFVSFTQDVGSLSHTKGARGERSHNSGVKARDKTHNARGAKIGINPRSTYDTPTAIYTYPVDYVLSKNGRVDFAENAPYVQVVRATGNILYLNKITTEDVSELSEKSGLKPHKPIFDTPAGHWWNILYRWAENLKVNGPEPVEPDPDDYEESEDFHAAYAEYVVELDAYNAESQEGNLGKSAARILRKLGYDGVVDYDWEKGTGEGIIHRNEPSQAFFLSMKPLKLVETIHNKSEPSEPKSDLAIWLNKPHIFVNLMKKGKLTDEQIIEFLVKAQSLANAHRIWNDLPETVKTKILNDPVGIAGDRGFTIYNMAVFPTDKQIEIIRAKPSAFNVLRDITPQTFEWLSENPNLVIRGDLRLSAFPPEIVARMAKKDPNILYSLKGSPDMVSEELLLAVMNFDLNHFAHQFGNSYEFYRVSDRILVEYWKRLKKTKVNMIDYIDRLPARNFTDKQIALAIGLLPRTQIEKLRKYSLSNSRIGHILDTYFPVDETGIGS